MRKTFVIIIAVGMIGLLNYGLRQNASASITPVGTANTASTASTATSGASGGYKDGTYTGSTEYNPYGDVQVAVVINGGKITDINYLQMPQGAGHTNYVTASVEPMLKQETLQAQNANISFISGATYTSQTYQASLQSALNQAAGGSGNASTPSGSSTSPTTQPQSLPGDSGGYDN